MTSREDPPAPHTTGTLVTARPVTHRSRPPAGPPPARDAEELPYPPRYWWLKRILVGLVFVTALLVGLYFWWDREAQRRIKKTLDRYRAAGQPLRIEDFQSPPVPAPENAALPLMAAAAKVDSVPEDLWTLCESLATPTPNKQAADIIGRWVSKNQPALDLVHGARGKPGVDWGFPLTYPIVNKLFCQLGYQQRLARFIIAAAVYEHHRGDDHAAIERIRDALLVERSLLRWRGTLRANLAGVTVGELTCDGIRLVAPTLRLETTSSDAVQPAKPAQLRALIADLLDDDLIRKSWRNAVYAERAALIDTLIGPRGCWNGSQGTLPWFVRPPALLGLASGLEYLTHWTTLADAPNLPAGRRQLAPFPSRSCGLQRQAFQLVDVWIPSLDGAAEITFRLIAEQRLAATALAIRWYEADHGHRPETLDMLVPAYLPAVPADPCASGDRPITYRPNGPHPRLYSFGLNLTDDGGTPGCDDAGRLEAATSDLVFFLAPPRRAPPAR